MVAFARRLTGFILAFSMLAGLPIAAARAGCVCDHGHDGTATGSATPHECTAACTAETCPMHRRTTPAAHDKTGAARGGDVMRCGCAGQAQALIAQATVVGVLPASVSFDAPVFARPARTSAAEAPLSLAASPPAPPPRA